MPQLTDTFAALGNATRFAIVERLLKEGELPAGEFLRDQTISPPAMSHHLKVLRKAGIVNQRIDRQRRMYSVRPEAVRAVGAWTLNHRDFWMKSLDRLEAALAGRGGGR
ncbi:MAG TPA: metalloregulator ArsR/SmtB family transcription factor [Devosiaceae bacterium]|nr:metalloregulator ArsR/SmtB family transcription factor [Devosiaceae bacterium]